MHTAYLGGFKEKLESLFSVLNLFLMLKEVGNIIQTMFFTHRKNFRGDSLNLIWRQGCKKWHFYSYKWPYWPGFLNTIASSTFDKFSRSNLPKHLNFDISKAPPAFTCLEKVFVIAYNYQISNLVELLANQIHTLLLKLDFTIWRLKMIIYHR